VSAGDDKPEKTPGRPLENLAAPIADLPIPGPDEAKPLARTGPGLEVPVVPAKVAPMGQPKQASPAEAAAALHRAGRTDEAIQAYIGVLKDDPGDARTWANLGVALRVRGKLEAAAACYRRALALEPKSAAVLSNLGNVLRMLGRHEEAAQCQRRALEADPTYLIAAYNMGLQLRDLGLNREALTYFDRAIHGGYARPEVMLDRAYTHLALGDYAMGFAEYEVRLRLPNAPNPPSPAPEWDGGAIQGKSILVHVEPGPRDTITFLRYAPLLAARGAKVVVLAPAPMARLAAALPGVAEVISQGKPPATDLRAPLNSLPRMFGATLETLPAEAAYLRVPLDKPMRGWAPVPPGTLKVGVSWAERSADPDRAARACPFTQFLRLAGVPGVQLFKLQTGPAAAERDQHGAGALVRDFAAEFADLGDAAEAVSQLDLVIGVDSAMTLLAGALGKPGFVALASNADWRWGAGGETSPWFPSLRLFRQRRPGDWEELFQRLVAALSARATGMPEPATAARPAPTQTEAASAAGAKPRRAAKRPQRKTTAEPDTEPPSPPEAAPPPVAAPPKPLHIPGILPQAEKPESPIPLPGATLQPQAPAASPAWPQMDRRAGYVQLRAPEPAPTSPPSAAPAAAPAAPEPMPVLAPELAQLLDRLASRGGLRLGMRRFLDRYLKPGEVVVDVGVGDGLAALAAAARHPGRVHVIALDSDIERVRNLREAADAHGLGEAIETLTAGAGARATQGAAGVTVTVDGLLSSRYDLGRRPVFLCLDSEGREPEIVAGALELIAGRRLAAILWRRASVYDEPAGAKRLQRLLEDLSGLGFGHFHVDAADPEALRPYDGAGPAGLVASLPRGFAER
jgi:tetratricopeptide (TPR) repeat protein